MKYNDYPEQLPEHVIEKLSAGFSEQKNTEITENKEKFMVCELKKFELDSKLITLYETLFKCEKHLEILKKLDKKNEKFLYNTLQQTKEHKIDILNCCYNPNNIDCNYYSTGIPNFNRCCANYCNCEISVIEQLLFLCALKNSNLNNLLLFNMLQKRFSCFAQIVKKYTK